MTWTFDVDPRSTCPTVEVKVDGRVNVSVAVKDHGGVDDHVKVEEAEDRVKECAGLFMNRASIGDAAQPSRMWRGGSS